MDLLSMLKFFMDFEIATDVTWLACETGKAVHRISGHSSRPHFIKRASLPDRI